jgi:hypothetical protein
MCVTALVRILAHFYRVDREMAKNGSWAVSALSTHCPENKQRLREAGAEDLLSQVVVHRLSQSDPLLYSCIAKAAHDQLRA